MEKMMDMFMDCRSRYFERVSWEAFGSMRETELNMLLDMKVDDVEDRINLVYLWQNHPIKTRVVIQFADVHPQAINGERLYEREDACKILALHLINGSGRRLTPIADNMFGSGKTSLVFKFRSILNELDWPERPPAYSSLKAAVYLHTPFAVKGKLPTSRAEMVCLILTTVRKSLRLSCNSQADFDGDDLPSFLHNMTKLCGQTKFLLHFDEVGCFEPIGSAFAAAILYTMWDVGNELRSAGHYFIMTGRSSLLHLIGTGQLRSRAFCSPDRTVIIPLPPLSTTAIQSMLTEYNLDRVIHQVDAIHALTGGVPRAVYTVVQFFKVHANATTVEENMEELLTALEVLCPQPLNAADAGIFKRCVELSWAGISVSDDVLINDEPVTSLMARLGIYRRNIASTTRFELLVPLFVLKLHLPSVRSLLAISEYLEKGDRLECGFRRIFQLRFAFSPCLRWDDLDLPFLGQCHVPFPTTFQPDSYVFPKIAKDNSWSEPVIKQVMQAIHERRPQDACRQEFALSALPILMTHMKCGHFYLPLPKSGSADALLKCSDTEVVSLQFKNSKSPITESTVDAEAAKCVSHGFQVFLIVVCAGGNDRGADYQKHVNGVNVVVLSKESVELFLGHRCLKNFCSNSLIGDIADRIKITHTKSISLVELGVELDNL